jgi:hypothetical protein
MDMKERRTTNWLDQAIPAALFAAAGVALLVWFVLFARPAERTHLQTARAACDEQPLLAVLATNGFEARLAEIDCAGRREGERAVGRLSGSPGCYRTEALIADAFRAAGLDVTTQALRVVVPVAEVCELVDAQGQPLAGVQLYPFAPAGILPAALPREGIAAELAVTEGSALRYLDGHAPTSTIVVTWLDAVEDWPALANAGFPALLVREDDLARSMRASPDQVGPWRNVRNLHEAEFPRFVVRGPIDRYAGQRVTLRCRVTWQPRVVRNVIGVLRGRAVPREALVLTAFYDSNSVVPELAPGAEQAISPALLLEYARALAPYRGQLQRDVVFVATAGHAQGLAGVSRLLESIERVSARQAGHRTLAQRRVEHARREEWARHALAIIDALPPAPGAAGLSPAAWAREDAGFRQWLEPLFATAAGEVALDRREEMLAARLAYLRAGSPIFREGFDPLQASDAARKAPENGHPLLRAYLDAKAQENRAGVIAGVSLPEAAGRDEFVRWGYAARLRTLVEQAAAYHAQEIRELDDSLAVQRLFAPYARTLTLNLELYSGGVRQGGDLALLVGVARAGTAVEPQVTELANTIQEKVARRNGLPAWRVVQWGARDAQGSAERPNSISTVLTELESEPWFLCWRQAFTLSNYNFFPPRVWSPEDTFDRLQLDQVRAWAPTLGRAILAVASGRVTCKGVSPDAQRRLFTTRGRVLASVGASSLVPSHPMTPRTFVRPYRITYRDWDGFECRGIDAYPVLEANPYGEYQRKMCFDLGRSGTLHVDAARFDGDGRVLYVKDASPAGQAVLKSDGVLGITTAMAGSFPKPIHVPVFRATPVAVYDAANPKTLRGFQRVAFLTRSGSGRIWQGKYTTFLDPDARFDVGLMDAPPDNDELLTYRAFLLNVDPDEPVRPGETELYGRGYLAADTRTLVLPHLDAAASMLRTASKRLAVQRSFGMADEQMLGVHARAQEWLAAAQADRRSNETARAVVEAGASLAYAIKNHPVIRERIAQAVIGILWYLGLLVPFVFFAEKLLFGFTDIRKQLLAGGLIFLAVFALLRACHPAFAMVRSSLVILLGFVILLLTLLVTLLVGGKFRQNIRDLRRHEGRVEGADVNRSGVVGTAFMLGLNNMRRRKVRTALTCVTLVLITFVMICFTSVSSELVSSESLTGRSPWNGILIRKPNYLGLDNAEIGNLRRLYAERYPVTTWQWLTPWMSIWGPERLQNPEVLVDRDVDAGGGARTVKRARLNGVVKMEWNEPMFSGIDRLLLTKRGWFPRPPITRAEKEEAARRGYRQTFNVILPDNVARELGITVDDVNRGGQKVVIRGDEYEVTGIIDAVELNRTLGLDGQTVLPYDLNGVPSLGIKGQERIVPDEVAHLSAGQVLIVDRMPSPKPDERTPTIAFAVLFPRVPFQVRPDQPMRPAVGYREQRQVVEEYLERLGRAAHYAVDGNAYYGSRQRARTVAGLLDLLVPILLAALTVFNTMRSSVYERRDEIYVYNAVGIAPNHVFFIFMAEACVYAVVGAMLGYLLSQGVGRALTALHLTGGMNLEYSSIETIYASLAIVAATLLSTVLPARDAARLASPADTPDWAVPKVQGDEMTLALPFTFTPHDRVAVVSYFARWLDANGAGSSGPFYCSAPAALVREEPSGPGGTPEAVPVVASTIWLKPYDLGVSQRMEIALPTDPETGEYIARIRLVRLSGPLQTWARMIKPFLGTLRKQFLNWRVTTRADRGEMFAEARDLLRRGARAGNPEETTHG